MPGLALSDEQIASSGHGQRAAGSERAVRVSDEATLQAGNGVDEVVFEGMTVF
jgi:hypothetical protein